MPQDTAPTRDYLWLAAILVLALVLRVIGLDAPLWYDEIITLDSHVLLPWHELMQTYSLNFHYLHSLQAKAVILLLGEHNWTLRLPAMLFGTGSIAAAWWLTRDIADTRIAHLVAALLAISYHHIWFSQNARGYTELAFWGTLGMIFFLRGVKRPGFAVWLGFGITLFLATFTHLTGAFLYAAQGLVLVSILVLDAVRGRFDPRLVLWPAIGAAVGVALTFLAYLPILPDMMTTVGAVSETSANDHMVEYQSPLWTMAEAVRSALGAVGPLVAVLGAGVITLVLLGSIAARRAAPAFAPTVLVHIGLTIALLLALDMRIWPRFFFADIAFLMILIVLGVRLVCTAMALGREPMAGRLFVLASVAMVLLSGGLALRNYTAPKQDFADAFALIAAERQPGERAYGIGIAAGSLNNLIVDHYHADVALILDPASYDAAVDAPGPLWLVVAFPQRNFRAYPRLDGDTNASFKLVQRFPGTMGDGNVLVFRRD